MNLPRLSVVLLTWVGALGTTAQPLQLSGYLKDMQAVYYLETPVQLGEQHLSWTTCNLVHHRLNLNWYATDALHLSAGIRNRWMTGPLVRQVPAYAEAMAHEEGWMRLRWNLMSGKGYVLNAQLDRLSVDYTWRQFQLRVGRQRINWGMSLVWNPNELFNAFSFTDFDYEERPGCDALQFTWYTSGQSNLEVVARTDSSRSLTLASRYVFNHRDWDIQVLAGTMINDVVFGGGCTGAVGLVSIRSEGTVFIPINGASPTAVSATLSADRTLENHLYLHAAYLYNSLGGRGSGNRPLFDPSNNLSAKMLSTGKHEIFAQTAYPLTPLINLGGACLLNPIDGSAYLSTNLSISLLDDLELLLTAQCLLGKPGSEYGYLGNTWAGFARLKWSY